MNPLRNLPIIATVIAAVSLASCSLSHSISNEDMIERVLTSEGNNCPELEKVLVQYTSAPEKSEAWRWLISTYLRTADARRCVRDKRYA